MKVKLMAALFGALLTVGVSTQAQAGYQYVGSWEVNSGPWWGTEPLAYTGQQAAALLYGGSFGDYVISTTGSDTSLINFLSWYSILGYGGAHNGGVELAQDYVSLNSTQAPGYYYSGDSYSHDGTDAASAYVSDNAGVGNINYAFRIINDVPEPGTLFLLGLGMTAALAVRRRMN